jgi:putative ABC transport system ATP-binding protein
VPWPSAIRANSPAASLQRIAIARALVHRPRLVLADEPTGNLDARTADQILRLLREQLQATQASGILITHSMTAARTAERILRLRAAANCSHSP